MEQDTEHKRLIPVTMDYSDKDNIWTMNIENGGKYNFKATQEQVYKLLRKCRAKDSMTLPASRKKRTYNDMIQAMKNKKYAKVYMWKSKLPMSLEDVKNLMKDE